jgi:hypothetical protein
MTSGQIDDRIVSGKKFRETMAPSWGIPKW